MDRPRYASYWTDPSAMPKDADERELLMAARSMLTARSALANVIPSELLHDPSLSILLMMFVAPPYAPLSVGDFADATGLTPIMVTRWLTVLEDKGLVRSRAQAQSAQFTDAGRDLVIRAIRAVIESQQDLHLANLH